MTMTCGCEYDNPSGLWLKRCNTHLSPMGPQPSPTADERDRFRALANQLAGVLESVLMNHTYVGNRDRARRILDAAYEAGLLDEQTRS